MQQICGHAQRKQPRNQHPAAAAAGQPVRLPRPAAHTLVGYVCGVRSNSSDMWRSSRKKEKDRQIIFRKIDYRCVACKAEQRWGRTHRSFQLQSRRPSGKIRRGKAAPRVRHTTLWVPGCPWYRPAPGHWRCQRTSMALRQSGTALASIHRLPCTAAPAVEVFQLFLLLLPLH